MSKATPPSTDQHGRFPPPAQTERQRRHLRLRRRPEVPCPEIDETLSVIVDHGKEADTAWEAITDIRRTVIKLESGFWKHPIWNRGGFRLIRAIAWGVKLWWVSLRTKDDRAIITYGHEHGFVFALLQFMVSPLRKRRTHLMFDLLLMPPRRGTIGLLDRAKMRLFDKVVDAAVVWGKRDVQSFAKWYHLSESKFIFHHYHTTLQNFEFTVKQGDYIFAGGNSARDYKTFIEAVRDLDVPVFIATTARGVAEMTSQCPHITVRGVSEQEFRTLLAGCRIFIEAHDKDFPRTSGHQTMLNAMACGKPVVIADQVSAEWYVRDGIDGLVVPIADPDAMKRAISSLLNNESLASRLAQNAVDRFREGQFEIPRTLASIYRLALSMQSPQSWTQVGNQSAPSETINRMEVEQLT
jgi:hypothetical protein